MLLHGEQVFKGDRVYDISANRGYGYVVDYTDNVLNVAFGDRKIPYMTNGVQRGMKNPTLFWNVPVIVAPKKNEKHWTERQAMYDSMFRIFEQYKQLTNEAN